MFSSQFLLSTIDQNFMINYTNVYCIYIVYIIFFCPKFSKLSIFDIFSAKFDYVYLKYFGLVD